MPSHYKTQGYNSRLDESIGMKHRGAHSQSMKDRRDESKGMAKKMTGHAYSGDHSMDKHYPKSVKSHLGKLIRK
tara:strand:+ start:1171 stop:1392 length:222 start_codon:yes stop_codon:yes gene_type:complete